MPPSAAEAQLALVRRILGGEAPELEGLVEVPPGVDVATRIGVHTGGYPARIRESLRESFPALAHVLGASDFAALAERYLPRIPAAAVNLNAVGCALPDFLATDRALRGLPFLPDLARLEWCVCVAFHARLRPPFDARACAHWSPDDWSRAEVGFQPGVALLRSPWPIHSLRECRHVPRDEVDVAVADRPEDVLVHRDGLEVVVRVIGDLEAAALEPLLAGAPLGRTLADLAARGADPDEVSRLFGAWSGAGLVADCRTR